MVFSVEEKKQRKKESNRKYRENNKLKIKEYRENNKENNKLKKKEYYQNNKDLIKEYRDKYQQTSNGKKNYRINNWLKYGLIETPEFIEEIYDMWLHQEECNACGIELTRTGTGCSTDVCMDHDHDTHKFRHIICRTCNINDSFLKYFII